MVNQKSIVNDFCVTFSTINGSGSATANTIMMRSLFHMGIPVSGKNIFPSNIQGLPTWFSLRVSKDGFTARIEHDDIVVVLNPTIIMKEVDFLIPGGVLFYADDIKIEGIREDIITYPMPIKKLIKDTEIAPNMRDYIANMVYVGVLAEKLGIGLENIHRALEVQFKGKKKPVASNYEVIKNAYEWSAANLEKKDAYRVKAMSANQGMILADGNSAAALGAIYGGVQFTAWYPITPASTLVETLMEYMPSLRKNPETGKVSSAIVQAEDELSAVGMAIGAGWAGLRAMTSTSGPGLSLMSEYLGLAYYTEVPLVVWDVQRVGPSTGLPTRTAQGDITQAYFLSHGDRQFILLFPGTIQECFEFGWRAFDIAERLQTPVLVLIDLDMGMNQWMTKEFEYPTMPMDRGKILWEDDLEALLQQRKGDYGRYLDIDGDHVPYRTVMGNTHPRSAYFTRGTGHDEYGKYSEDPATWERMMNRLKAKIEKGKEHLPKAIITQAKNAKFGIIATGSTDPAIMEARTLLERKGIEVDYLRVRSIPFGDEVREFAKAHDRCYVVELNRDGQLKQLLTLEITEFASHFKQISHVDGLPMTAKQIIAEIKEQEGF
jgi:2-oxoglutarate ferredoxin oxidoreductase subunit alpha